MKIGIPKEIKEQEYRVSITPAATYKLINVTHRYVELLAENGLEDACRLQPALVGGINVMNGGVTCKEVALAHDLPCQEVSIGS